MKIYLLVLLLASCGEPSTSELASGSEPMDETGEPSADLVASPENCEDHYRRLATAQLTYQQVSGFAVDEKYEYMMGDQPKKGDHLFVHCRHLAGMLNERFKTDNDHSCHLQGLVSHSFTVLEYLGDARGLLNFERVFTRKPYDPSIDGGLSVADRNKFNPRGMVLRFKDNSCELIDRAINKLYDATLELRKRYAKLRNQCVKNAIKVMQLGPPAEQGAYPTHWWYEKNSLLPCLMIDHLLFPFIDITDETAAGTIDDRAGVDGG